MINREILNITEAIKQTVPVERIYLFGSYAYGTPNAYSDYDFFIVTPDDGINPIDVARNVRRAIAHIKRHTPVDIVTNSSSRFDELAKLPTLERTVAKEGMLLYESY
jgi:predicted nucleotidyltransferase